MTSERVRVAILDDYQGVAFKFGDWTSIDSRLIIDKFPDTTVEEDVLANNDGIEALEASADRPRHTCSCRRASPISASLRPCR